MQKHIAVDLGASTGRVIVGDLSSLDIISRFPSKAVRIKDSLYWDILGIYAEIKAGLKEAFRKYGDEITSIGIDTWGVDYALLDKNGDLLGNPYHYRDDRTSGAMDEVFNLISGEEIYQETGIQFLPFNTIFQLYAAAKQAPEVLGAARHYLSIPDLLNYWLTGEMRNEYSHFTTTQLYNPRTKARSVPILKALGVDPDIFCEIAPSGTVLGPLLPSVAEELGAGPEVQVILPGCHDTASAVAAVPTLGEKTYAYLSSGTWSLLGIESDRPIISAESYGGNFTNEGSVTGGFRFLKNIMGLWIIQECKASWDQTEEKLEWPQIIQAAEKAEDRGFRIDVDDLLFLGSSLTSGPMPGRIREYLRARDLPLPETVGEMALCVFKSLAETYARVLGQLEAAAGLALEELYIIGGGCQNDYLCRLTAQAVGRPVFAGPAEATALGNILVQAVARGEVKDLREGRGLIAENFEIITYERGENNESSGY